MSILDRGPHSVVVTPKVKVPNGYGENELADGDPVTVSGLSVQPVTAEELNAFGGGMQAWTTRRIIGRGPWPGGIHSTIQFDGRTWEQFGEAEFYTTGRRTKHFSCMIRARFAEVF